MHNILELFDYRGDEYDLSLTRISELHSCRPSLTTLAIQWSRVNGPISAGYYDYGLTSECSQFARHIAKFGDLRELRILTPPTPNTPWNFGLDYPGAITCPYRKTAAKIHKSIR